MTGAAGLSPPDGFVPMARRGAFLRLSGPYFERVREHGAEQAFLATEDHCNAQDFVHGGMLGAFLDGLLAQAVRRESGGPVAVTIHLSVDFLAAARAGEWVIGERVVTRDGRGVMFVEGRLHSGGRDVVRGSGVFRSERPATST
jgi:acyl-coenzyme A thioesterase PaaI-like protein